MLTKTSIEASYGLAAQVTRANRVLTARPGTVLADIAACCSPRGFDLPEGEPEPAIEELVVESSMVSSGLDVSDHELAHDRAVELGSQAVAFVFDCARNRVTPQVRRVTEKTEAYVANRSVEDAQRLTIHPRFLGNVYKSMALADMTANYKNQVQVPDAPAVVLKHVWPGSIMKALGTGDSLLDGEIAEHLRDEPTVKEVWERTFAANPGMYRDSDPFKAYPDLDSNLIVFLGAQNLLDAEPPEDLDMSLASYRAHLANLIAFTGGQLNTKIDRANTESKHQMLVQSHPGAAATGIPSGTIVVNGDVYNRWLSEGGSPEALMGAVTAGAQLSYDAILADAENHVSLWNRRFGLYEDTARSRIQAATISGLRAALIDEAVDMQDEGVLPADIDTVIAAINERLGHFHPDDTQRVYMVARKAVCRIFYPHLPVEKILNAMDAGMQNHPTMDISEVAYLVLVDYVASWVAGDIVVNAVDGTN